MSDEITLGPIDYLVIEFAQPDFKGEGIDSLLSLVDQGVIRILDAAVVQNSDGKYVGLNIDALDQLGGLWDQFSGVSSGLLNQDDFDAVGALMAPGSIAAILVYENAWAGPFVNAMRRAGGSLLSYGRVGVEDIEAALAR